MPKKQLSGPATVVILVIVVILAIGAGYYYFNKDSMGKEGEARKLNPPGVLSKDYDPKKGPNPSNATVAGPHGTSGATSGAGQRPGN